MLADERHDVLSIHYELRGIAWAGALLLAGAAAAFLARHDIGPRTLASLIAIAAIACYAWAWRHRAEPSLIDDYVLLLGALLVSADFGYLENKFHLLDANWSKHFLLLAIFHGVTAYLFDSRLVLSLSISALAAWLGVEQRRGVIDYFDVNAGVAQRMVLTSVVILIWRAADRRLRGSRTFERTFEHFAANLALTGSLVYGNASDVSRAWLLVTVALAAAVIAWGFVKRTESFVLYGFVYGVLAIDCLVLDRLHHGTITIAYFLVSTTAAIVALFLLRGQFRRRMG